MRSALLIAIALMVHSSWASYHVLVAEREVDNNDLQDFDLLHSRPKRSLVDPNDILDSLSDEREESGSGSENAVFSRVQTIQFFVKNPDKKYSAKATLSDVMPGDAILTDFSIHSHDNSYQFDKSKAMRKHEATREYQQSADSGRSVIMIGDVQTIDSRCSDCRISTDETSSVTAVITIAPGDVLSVSLSFMVPLEINSIEYLKDLYRTDTTIEVRPPATDFSGVIMSPNYPDPYPNNADITWLIRFPIDDVVVNASLISFQSESCCDHLYIYDGELDSSPLLAVVSGKTFSSDPILSTGSSMLLKFQSDCLGNDGGFSMEFSTASVQNKSPSNQTFDVLSNNGAVYCSGYPMSYPPLSTLTWTITSDAESYLSLEIIDFDVSSGESLLIYDDLTGDILLSLSSSSTATSRDVIGTSGNKALIIFTSTERIIPKRGFYIKFDSYSIENPCSYEISLESNDFEERFLTSPNYPQNYGNNELCTWVISVPSPNLIKIEVETFDLESGFDFLEVYGDNREDPIATLSGSAGDLEYIADGNTATVVFKSDSTQTDGGFKIRYRNYPVLKGCSGSATQELDMAEGLVTNPQFPSSDYNYYGTECTWLITVSDDKIVTLNLFYIYLYSSSASITFYDGDSKQDNVLWSGRSSDWYNWNIQRASSNKVLVYFRNPYSYYDFTYSFSFNETQEVPSTCGTTLMSSPGVIKSLNYPRYNKRYTACNWLIQAPVGDTITLEIDQLSYEYYSDYITFYNGNSASSSVLLKCYYYYSYCYSGTTVTSSSNSLYIYASTSTSSVYFKFKFHFSSDSGGDENEVYSSGYSYLNYDSDYYYSYGTENNFKSPGAPGPYPPNSDFFWYTDCGTNGYRVRYTFYRVDIDSSDFIKVYEDYGTDENNLVTTLGDSNSFYSNYNYYAYGAHSTVWLHSDSQFSGEGFFATYYCYY